ncbi:hypothetical protein LEMLEM_LOCUS18059 [Lemmus lemmus]
MAKATKKSQDPATDTPSTSGTMPKKVKTSRAPRTNGKKNGGAFSFSFGCPNKAPPESSSRFALCRQTDAARPLSRANQRAALSTWSRETPELRARSSLLL